MEMFGGVRYVGAKAVTCGGIRLSEAAVPTEMYDERRGCRPGPRNTDGCRALLHCYGTQDAEIVDKRVRDRCWMKQKEDVTGEREYWWK